MHGTLRRLVLGAAFAALLGASAPPVAPVRPVVDDYFGTKVTDPYRWMESGGAEFDAYVRSQNAVTRAALDTIPGRAGLIDAMKAGLAAAGPAGALDLIASAGSRIFFSSRTPSGRYHAVFVRENGATRPLFDPNTLAADQRGDVAQIAAAPDAQHLVVAIDRGGSEQKSLYVVAVPSGDAHLENATPFVAFNVHWLDAASFTYVRVDATANARLARTLLHRIGTPIDVDAVLAGTGIAPALALNAIDGAQIVAVPPRWAVAIVNHGVDHHLEAYVAPLAAARTSAAPWRKVIASSDRVVDVAASGDDLFALTSTDAPHRKVVRTSLAASAPLATVVPERPVYLTSVSAVRDQVYVADRDGSAAHVRRFDRSGRALPLVLPPLASVQGPFGNDGSTRLLVRGANFNDPQRVFTVDPQTGAVDESGLTPPAPAAYANLRVENVTARSADGTLVPLTIVARRDVPHDGTAPAILVGYGSYGATPYEAPFPPFFLGVLDRGIVIAVAHVRGGGELGDAWYAAGKGANKTKTVDDFIACAQTLVQGKWTSSARLAAWGQSAGGITVGRAMTREPKLFAAVVSQVGVNDTLRFEKTPNGPGNVPEFGSTSTEAGFRALYDMSTYQHVVDGTTYPAVLLTTGLNDPRVSPWQVAKLAARLQAASPATPTMLRVEESAGHGYGDALDTILNETADIVSFILWRDGVAGFQPVSATPAR